MFLSAQNRYVSKQENFAKIPGSPVAYWASDAVISLYTHSINAGNIAEFKHGMSTGKNEAVVRLWYEVIFDEIAFDKKSHDEFHQSAKRFVPYNKGGGYRKWYGNQEYIIGYDFEYDKLMDSFSGHRHDNKESYFKTCISWSKVTSSGLAMRYFPEGFIYDVAGCSLFTKHEYLKYLLAFFNLKVKDVTVAALSPTLNFEVGQLRKSPIIYNRIEKNEIDSFVDSCIMISKSDWDSFETSWDFQTHPLLVPSALDMTGLITAKQPTLAKRYEQFKAVCKDRFDILKDNEEDLNRIFIDIYGLQDELTPEESDKDVTVHRVFDTKDDVPESMKDSNYVLTKEDVMKSLLSYAVGCLFGRYSLDTPGLAYAGGEWDAGKYRTFIPDDDNVVPITDEEYFDDDLSSFICAWLKKAFGRENFEANLAFLTDALGTRGTTPKEKLRNYFLKDFFKDHCKTYQKRPIYWLFDSGKENGFKALVYLHRYDENTIGRVRADYLHRMERIYSNEVNRMQDVIAHSHSAHEVSVAEKRLEKMKKQIKECQDYDAKLGRLALDQIHLDLDDGVKINYRKAQTGRDGKFYEVLADSKNIMAKDALWHEYLTEWYHEQ